MIERITPDNPLTERHAGMMAVFHDRTTCSGPIFYSKIAGAWFCPRHNRSWDKTGRDNSGEGLIDIIAVLPMPDLSRLEGE